MHEMTSVDKYVYLAIAVVILAIGVFRLDHLFLKAKPTRKRPPSAVSRTWILEEIRDDDEPQPPEAEPEAFQRDNLGDYFRDISKLLSKNAFAAKRDAREASPSERSFLEGKLLAYNEVLSLMTRRAVAFGLDLDATGLKRLDPDQKLHS